MKTIIKNTIKIILFFIACGIFGFVLAFVGVWIFP